MYRNYDHYSSCTPTKKYPVRGNHDILLNFPDSDSGFSSSFKMKSQPFLKSDNFSSSTLTRSQSLTKLHGDSSGAWGDVANSCFEDSTMRELKECLEDSENRRSTLMQKLKEAQDTLQVQSEGLLRIEHTARDNNTVLDELKMREKEYRKKISSLERTNSEKEVLQQENHRLKEEMQERINTLHHQLKNLQSQHRYKEEENQKRLRNSEQTAAALHQCKDENLKLERERDAMKNELDIYKESLRLIKQRCGMLEDKSNMLGSDLEKLEQENENIEQKLQKSLKQLKAEKETAAMYRAENERLAIGWKSLTDEKNCISRQLDLCQEMMEEQNIQMEVFHDDKTKMQRDYQEIQQKIHQLVMDKEHLIKEKTEVEEQQCQYQHEVTRCRLAVTEKEEERRNVEKEMYAVKKVSTDLSSELASVKRFYEQALEQISQLETTKDSAEQQLQLLRQENQHLEADISRLKDNMDEKVKESRKEKEILEESFLKLKNETQQLHQDKSQLEEKYKGFVKLKQVNENMKDAISLQQDELSTWKTTCEHLSAAVSRKEGEIQTLTDRLHDLERTCIRLKEECQSCKDQSRQLLNEHEDADRLKEENRRLLQEKAENEQMIQLLETEKEVLAKNSEAHMFNVQDITHLQQKNDQLRSENFMLKNKVADLEHLKTNLIKQKEDLLVNSELVYKNRSPADIWNELDKLQNCNRQLKESNDFLSEKVALIQQENAELKARESTFDLLPKEKYDGMKREYQLLQEEYNSLKEEHNHLKQRHQKFIIDYGHTDNSASDKELKKLKKEKEGLEKHVALIKGQMSLMEGTKKRNEEMLKKMEDELEQLKRAPQKLRNITENDAHKAEVKHLNAELEKLQKELEMQTAKVKSLKKEVEEGKMKKHSRNTESLEDTDEDLQDMRGELHNLMEIIKHKDKEIENMSGHFEASQKQVEGAEKSIQELKQVIQGLENNSKSLQKEDENKLFTKPVYKVLNQNAIAAKAEQKKLEDEQTDKPNVCADSPKKEIADDYKKSDISKYQSSPTLLARPHSENNERLQSLISKYRNFGEQYRFSSSRRRPLSFTVEQGSSSTLSLNRMLSLTTPKLYPISSSIQERMQTFEKGNPAFLRASPVHEDNKTGLQQKAENDVQVTTSALHNKSESVKETVEEEEISMLIEKYLQALET